jgi:hypothetical protein
MNYYNQIFNLLLEAQGDNKYGPAHRAYLRGRAHDDRRKEAEQRGDPIPHWDRTKAHQGARGITQNMKRAGQTTSQPPRIGKVHKTALQLKRAEIEHRKSRRGPNLP